MKGLGLIIFGAVAVLSGIAVAIILIRRKRREAIDLEDYDVVDDEEFEHFFGSGSDEFDEDDLPN